MCRRARGWEEPATPPCDPPDTQRSCARSSCCVPRASRCEPDVSERNERAHHALPCASARGQCIALAGNSVLNPTIHGILHLISVKLSGFPTFASRQSLASRFLLQCRAFPPWLHRRLPARPRCVIPCLQRFRAPPQISCARVALRWRCGALPCPGYVAMCVCEPRCSCRFGGHLHAVVFFLHHRHRPPPPQWHSFWRSRRRFFLSLS